MKLSIIGLGKLGSPMSAVMAHKGHTVVGVDINPDSVKAIQEGRPPVNEPQLAELITANRERLTATENYEEAILATDVTFIIVPTPSGPDGRFSMKFAIKAAEKIGAALRKKNAWHLVVLSSTVMPGCTGGEMLPALIQHSGKRCPEEFGLCYNPEFIALGSVVRDMLRPDMILIGESDKRSGDILEELYTGVCESGPRIQRMNYVNAELTKLSVNTFVTTKISYANMLAQVCETLPGADSDVVTAAIGCDTRIGAKYLKGALGYGGPCFPRDNIAFSALARDNGAPALLAEATDALNKRQVPRLAQLVASHLPEGGTAAVLGLSYKPNTDVIEESQGVAIAQALLDAGQRVVVFDPAAMPNAKKALKGDVVFAASAEECIALAGAVVITTPWPEFQDLPLSVFQRAGDPLAVLDCWRVLPAEVAAGIERYMTLGKGTTAPKAASAD
ncbi:MAG: nucleotide sugar dehydrogenase [Candidatus Solibacter sp.]